jgi:hypothetical protein
VLKDCSVKTVGRLVVGRMIFDDWMVVVRMSFGRRSLKEGEGD